MTLALSSDTREIYKIGDPAMSAGNELNTKSLFCVNHNSRIQWLLIVSQFICGSH